MSRSPTYVGRLDPQFRRFVNVVNVYPTSPASSSIGDKDEAVASLASSSCSEKFPEFLTVDAYTEDSLPQAQGQREVSEFFLEYANVLSTESETSFVTDDKEIATSATTSSWRENPQNVSNSEQRYSQDRIPSDCSREDSVFLSDGCGESFYEENGINYCLQKRPGVSNKRHELNRPVSRSFSSEDDSERNNTYRNQAEERLAEFEGLPAREYSQRKENISSGPWLRGQEVISRSPQDTSRKIDDSFEDSYSVDSELCYSPDVIEDGYSSTSSADSSFVCFALVAKQGDERTKRKIASNVGRRDLNKKHRSKGSSKRRKSEGEDSNHGVTACVVSGISGGPAIRVYRDKDAKKSITRPKISDIDNLRKFRGAPPDERDTEGDATESNVLMGGNVRSEEAGHGFVFGVFGRPGNPTLKQKQSDAEDEKLLNLERGASSCDLEDVDAYNSGSATCPGNDLQNKPLVSLNNEKCATEYDSPRDNAVAISNATGNKSNYRSSREHKFNEISSNKPSRLSEENVQSSPSQWTDEPKQLAARQTQMTGVNEDDKDPCSSEIENGSKTRGGEVKERPIPLQTHPLGFRERTRDVRLNAISRSPQDRRRRKKLKEEEQHQKEPEKVNLREARNSNSTEEPDSSSPYREHHLKDGRFEVLSKPDKDAKVCELSLPFDSTNYVAVDPHEGKQDYQTTGQLEPKTENSQDETLLMAGGVQENMSDEYTADEVKTELLTPVKQTIHESIEACFVDHGKRSPNEEDQVCPDSLSDGKFETVSESYKQREGRIAAMEIAKGLHFNSGDILMKEDSPEDDFSLDHREILSKQENFDIGQKRDAGYDHRSNEEDGSNDSDECDPFDRDINDDLNAHDRRIATNANHFVLDSVSESKEEKNGLSFKRSYGVTTGKKVDVIGKWKPDSVICQESEVKDNNLQSKRLFDGDFQPMGETSGDQHGLSEKEFVRKLRKREKSSLPYDSQQRKFTQEAKRKNPEEEEQETKYSKKIKSLSNASPRRPKCSQIFLHLSDEFSETNSTGKSVLKQKSSYRPEESLATVTELPGSLLDEDQPSGKEKESKKYVFTKKQLSKAKPLAEDASEEKAMESAHSSTIDSTETTKGAEEFKPLLITAQAYVLTDNGAKNLSSVSELDVDRYVPPTATQAAVKHESQGLATPEICGHFDFNLGENSAEQFIEESAEISADSHHSSLPTSMFIKSTSHPEIEEIETASSTSKFEGKVQGVDLKYDKLSGRFGQDDSKLTNFPLKAEDRCHSIMLTEQCNVLVNNTKLSVSQEESSDHEEANGYFTKQSSAVTILPDTQKPEKSSEIFVVSPSKESYEDIERTSSPCEETLLAMRDTEEASPSVSAECLTFKHETDYNDLITAPEAPETEKPCVTEDVCFVSLDDSDKQSEDGALGAAELMSSSYHDETVVFSTKPNFVGNEAPDEANTFLEEREIDSREGVSSIMYVRDNCLILDERKSSENEVEEVVCSYQDPERLSQDQWNTGSRIDEVRPADSDTSANLQIDAESNVWFSTGLKDEDAQMDDMSRPSGESFEMRGVHVSESQMDETRVFREDPVSVLNDYLDNQDGFPFGSKALTNDCNANFPGWMSCNQSTHCGCLQRYLLHISQEKESECDEKPVASSATLQKPDKDPSLQEVNGAVEFGPARTNRYFTDASVKDVFDQQCQVELLTERTPPEYKTKQSQTSFLYSTFNMESQTDESREVDLVPEALQQQSVECQTEVPPNFYASCGVQVECLDYNKSQDGALEREDIVDEAQVRQDRKCRYTDKDCQTLPNYRPILTSCKQCQTVCFTEEPLRFPVDHVNANLDGTEGSRNVSFEDKECQTSEIYLLSSISSESASKGVSSSHVACLVNKECQTSRENMLLTSSAQCDILPSRDGEELLLVEGIETHQLPSHDNKESQTLLDNDLLLAASKFCQTSSSDFATEEIPVDCTNPGDASGTLYDSKECQTLFNSSIPVMSSKECQTIAAFASDDADTTNGCDVLQSVANNSKECQTTSDSSNDRDHLSSKLAKTMKEEFSVQSTQTDDTLARLNAIIYESKESQTTPDQQLLLSSSKVCQTANFEPAITFKNGESQTLPDGEVFLTSSKECQTMQYGLDDLNSKPPDDSFKGSDDIELSNVAIAGEHSTSPQMASLHRPATYGKSPEATEASFFESQSGEDVDASDLCQTNTEIASRPEGSSLAIDVSEKGCQVMLCNCGSCASDPQKGYFILFSFNLSS